MLLFSCKKVHDGVLHAAKLYPNAYIIMVVIGTLKGITFFNLLMNNILIIILFISIVV